MVYSVEFNSINHQYQRSFKTIGRINRLYMIYYTTVIIIVSVLDSNENCKYTLCVYETGTRFQYKIPNKIDYHSLKNHLFSQIFLDPTTIYETIFPNTRYHFDSLIVNSMSVGNNLILMPHEHAKI